MAGPKASARSGSRGGGRGRASCAILAALVLAMGLPEPAWAGGYPTANPAEGPHLLGGEVLVYQFDEGDVAAGSLQDQSGRGSHGILRGSWASTDAPHGFGKALRTTTTGYVEVSPASALSVGRDFTLAAWVYYEACTGEDDLYSQVSRSGGGTTLGEVLWTLTPAGRPCGSVTLKLGPGAAGTYDFPYAVPLHTWVHLAVVASSSPDTGSVSLVVDGQAVSQFLRPSNSTAPFTLSGQHTAVVATHWAKGSATNNSFRLDEFRVYDPALTEAQVASFKDLPYWHPNEPPVARIAPVPDAECLEGKATLTLDGTPSSDPDPGDLAHLTWAWTAPVPLDTPAAPTATGSFPLGSTGVGLTVADAQYSSSAAATVRVVDTVPPSTGHALSGTPGLNGWWRSAVDVTLAPSDACGLVELRHRVDQGPWLTSASFPRTLRVEGDGNHTVEYQALDLGGNPEPLRALAVNIDTTPPALAITTPQQGHAYVNDVDLGVPGLPTMAVLTLTVRADASDPVSGVQRAEFRIDGDLRRTDTSRPYNYVWDTSLEGLGAHAIEVRAYDEAGNEAVASRSLLTVPASPAGVLASVPGA